MLKVHVGHHSAALGVLLARHVYETPGEAQSQFVRPGTLGERDTRNCDEKHQGESSHNGDPSPRVQTRFRNRE